MKFSKFQSVEKFSPPILAIACIAVGWLAESKVLVLSIFMMTLVVYAVRRYNSKILVGIALCLLIAGAVHLALMMEVGAEQIAVLAYYFLAIGVIGELIEFVRRANGKK